MVFFKNVMCSQFEGDLLFTTLKKKRIKGLAGLQSMAVFNEISGVQEQNIECASVQFDLSVHFKCAHKILNLYL